MGVCGEREGEDAQIENQAETEQFNECVCLCMCEMIYGNLPGLLLLLCVFVFVSFMCVYLRTSACMFL